MATAEDDDYERLAYVQRLKAAIHYTVGKICEETAEDQGLTFNKQFTAVLAEATVKYCEKMATDLELFAKHGKRTTINCEDVKLFVRKSSQLLDHVTQMSSELTEANEERKQAKPKRGRTKKKSVAAPINTTEDSNMDED